MRFKGLDLNLLVALDALLTERSVSAAAERMFLSQPAMSGALNRLRDYFEDDLLVMSGRRMMLTPRAEALATPVRAALVQVETTVTSAPVFEPHHCDRRFVIEASDYICEVLIAPVARRLAVLAPNMILDIVPRRGSADASLESGEVDLVVTPDFYAATTHPAELLFEEDHLLVGWTGNLRLYPGIGVDDFYELGHVSVRFEKGRRSAFAENHLTGGERVRRIEITVGSFTEVPRFLIGTERVAIMHRRLALVFAEHLPLRLLPLPFELPLLKEVLQYHSIRERDQALTWLRGVVREVARAGLAAGPMALHDPLVDGPKDRLAVGAERLDADLVAKL